MKYELFNSFFIITQKFGNEFPDPKTGKPYYKSNFGMFGHNGIDLVPHNIKNDKNLYNRHNGLIVFVGLNGSYGNCIKIWNKELNILEYYCHLDSIEKDLIIGKELSERIFLGKIGNTGGSFGVHLHYGIFQVDEKGNKINTERNDKDCIKGAIDPLPFLKE